MTEQNQSDTHPALPGEGEETPRVSTDPVSSLSVEESGSPEATEPIATFDASSAAETPGESSASETLEISGSTAVNPTIPLSKSEPPSSPLLGGVGILPPAQPSIPPAAATQPAAWNQPEPIRGPRIGTVLWGLVIVVCAVVILAVALGAVVDFALVAIGVLGLAGASLVISSIVTSARRRRHS